MGIKAVGNEMPFRGIGVSFNHATDMKGIICFSTGVPHKWTNYLTTDDIKASNQRLGAVPDILTPPVVALSPVAEAPSGSKRSFA